MSVVWAARDNRLGRYVALKLLGPEAMPKPLLRQRFAREARITSRVHSPHVAQIVTDGVTSAGVPFVAMELLEGESLAAHLSHVGRCSLVTTGVILEQVCRALGAAHVAGLVHRDVKPANIFLTQLLNGSELFVRLLDFGIAKELLFGSSGLAQSGEMLGTADYMSPEQLCAPDSVGPAADIWSLGVVLYEMLTGKRPFDENTFPQLALRIAEGAFLPPSQICPDLPHEVDAVIARALDPDPNRRYATAAELGSAFLRVVRAHSSDSVVRKDVLDVLNTYAERSQQEVRDPRHVAVNDYAEQESASSGETTLRERLFGTLLVVLCIAVVFTSWLASGTLDNAPEHAAPLTSHAFAAAPASAAPTPNVEPPTPAQQPEIAGPPPVVETRIDALTATHQEQQPSAAAPHGSTPLTAAAHQALQTAAPPAAAHLSSPTPAAPHPSSLTPTAPYASPPSAAPYVSPPTPAAPHASLPTLPAAAPHALAPTPSATAARIQPPLPAAAPPKPVKPKHVQRAAPPPPLPAAPRILSPEESQYGF